MNKLVIKFIETSLIHPNNTNTHSHTPTHTFDSDEQPNNKNKNELSMLWNLIKSCLRY